MRLIRAVSPRKVIFANLISKWRIACFLHALFETLLSGMAQGPSGSQILREFLDIKKTSSKRTELSDDTYRNANICLAF